VTTEPAPLSVLERAVANATDLRPRTKALYLECVRSFLQYAPDPSNWTVGVVEDWLASLLATRKPQTVRVYRKGIRYASKRYAKREKKEDFASQADAIKADAPVRKPVLELGELQKLLRTCTGKNAMMNDVRDYALIMVAARTGLRRGGLAAMEWSNINFEAKTIKTNQKGGGTITFEADDETLEALQAWKKAIELGRAHVRSITGPVFCNICTKDGLVGGRMSDFQIWYVFKSRAKRAKMRHVHPHLMRHTTVTMLREEGVSPMDIRRLTGQTEKTIEDIYTHSRKTGAVGSAMPSLAGRKPKKTEDDK